MSGIAKITQRRNEETTAMEKGQGLELWLNKDGDSAIVSLIATGEPDDGRLDDFWVHTRNFIRDDGTNGWKHTFCEKALDDSKPCEFSHSEKGQYPSHQFGVWCYVHKIFYQDKRNDKCVEEKTKSGASVWSEKIEGFRVFVKGFGKGSYLWNQFVDIYNEDQILTKMLVKISRSGTGLNTTYSIRQGKAKSELPKEIMEKAKELPDIRDFFRQRYVVVSEITVKIEKSEKKIENPMRSDVKETDVKSDADEDLF